MKKLTILITIVTFTLFTSCKKDKKETVTEDTKTETKTTNTTITKERKKLQVRLESKSGSNVSGTAIFTQDDGIVTMIAVLDGLTEGTHAIHLHEKADCSAEDGTSTGGHWNPTKQPHGEWGSQNGYHKGDIGNFTADAKGNGMAKIITDEWCIGCGDETKDILGKAIIVHEGSDDFKTQPTGAAGGRVSCGGIIQ